MTGERPYYAKAGEMPWESLQRHQHFGERESILEKSNQRLK